MIENCNNKNLSQKGLDEKYFLLFQVWKELTEITTMDSYQYRTINTPSGISELSRVIAQRLSLSTNSNHNIDECKSELRKLISKDDTLEKHYPIIYRRLLSHLNEKTDDVNQQRVLRHQLEYCYNEITPKYFDYLFDDLEEGIFKKDNEGIIKITGRIVSCCISFGWSIQELNNTIEILCSSKELPEVWDLFKRAIEEQQEYTYSVYIPIKVAVKSSGKERKEKKELFHSELNELGITVKSHQQMTEIIKQICAPSGHLCTYDFMELSVSAIDFYSASNLAIRKCSEVLALFSFFFFDRCLEC